MPLRAPEAETRGGAAVALEMAAVVHVAQGGRAAMLLPGAVEPPAAIESEIPGNAVVISFIPLVDACVPAELEFGVPGTA